MLLPLRNEKCLSTCVNPDMNIIQCTHIPNIPGYSLKTYSFVSTEKDKSKSERLDHIKNARRERKGGRKKGKKKWKI